VEFTTAEAPTLPGIPGGYRVSVKVGNVQVEKVNDQMGQGRSV